MLVSSGLAGLTVLLFYLIVFLLVMCVLYFVVRRAVRDGIMDARAKVKDLEGPKAPTS